MPNPSFLKIAQKLSKFVIITPIRILMRLNEAVAICAEFPLARIIVLTTYDGDEDIYRGLHSGAQGYLLKDAKPHELLNAIRTVDRDQQMSNLDIATALIIGESTVKSHVNHIFSKLGVNDAPRGLARSGSHQSRDCCR